MKYWLRDQNPNNDIKVIAHSLALLNRYRGHSRFPLSVAQHSVLMANYAPNYVLHCLLHDAYEAFSGDKMPGEKTQKDTETENVFVKQLVESYKGEVNFEYVHHWDMRMRQTEINQLFDDPIDIGYEPIDGLIIREWTWTQAEAIFLNTFKTLVRAS